MFKLNQKEIILVALISVILGIAFMAAAQLGTLLTVLLTPLGLGFLGYEIIYGIWFMAAPIATYIIRKAGVGTIAETFAAIIELFLGGKTGPSLILVGIYQGIICELPFAVSKYKKYDRYRFVIAAVLVTIASFIRSYIVKGYFKLSIKILIFMFIVRLISALFFTAYLSRKISDKMKEAGVLKGYGISKK